MLDVAVVGLVCRDLVVAVESLPASGSAPVRTRVETLGGAANQAVAARQLGLSAGLVGNIGEDGAADLVLGQARRDGIDVSAVWRRPAGRTPLVVAVVNADGTNRLLEDVPPECLLTPADIRRAGPVLRAARAVLVDLQQPDDAVVEAARLAADAGAMVVLDGAPDDLASLGGLLRRVTVLRADEDEAVAYVGRPLDGVDDVLVAARELREKGPAVVVLGAGPAGNVVVGEDGERVYPLLGDGPIDPTGGGDAFVACLVTALLDGADLETAGWWASAAAALTVGRLGGRPALDRVMVADMAARAAGR